MLLNYDMRERTPLLELITFCFHGIRTTTETFNYLSIKSDRHYKMWKFQPMTTWETGAGSSLMYLQRQDDVNNLVRAACNGSTKEVIATK